MVFILQFVNVVYHTDWFADIEELLHPWDKSHLIMMYMIMYCWMWFASILLRIFASMFISEIGLFFGIFVCFPVPDPGISWHKGH